MDRPGLAPIRSLLEDPDVSEIMINGIHRVFVERKGRMELAPVVFRTEAEVEHLIDNLLMDTGRSVSAADPWVDVAFADVRVNVVVPPASVDGPVVTIRKYGTDIDSVDRLVALGTLDRPIADFLCDAVRDARNIVFSGATGSGKTTTLDALSRHIPADDRIVLIEDTAELRLTQPNVVRLQTRRANAQGAGAITLRDLFRNSLRMRPKRILVGEVRGAEAIDMIQAISSGHHGCMAVVHASSPRDVVTRLEVMMLQGGLSLPLDAIHRQIAESLDLIVQQRQEPDGTRRITHVTRVGGLDGDRIELHDLFVRERDGWRAAPA